MDIKIDSRPCAEDHSSPRSPLQVLYIYRVSRQNQSMAKEALTRESIYATVRSNLIMRVTENLQANLAI